MAIVCIGELVVDWLSFTPGEDFSTASQWYRALGGNSANVAVGLGRLGTPVRLVAKVGQDRHAEFLRKTLLDENVDCRFLVSDRGASTAQCYMLTTLDGEHTYYNWPQPHAADLLRQEEVPFEEVLEDARVLHTTSISLLSDPRRSTVEYAISVARTKGIIVSFDASLSKNQSVREHTLKVMQDADILKMNEPELAGWANILLPHFPESLPAGRNGSSDGARGFEQVHRLARGVFDTIRPKVMLVTLSARGSLVVLPEACIFCSPYKVDARSEVGAGDAYVAGILYGLMEIHGIRSASDLAGLPPSKWQELGACGNISGAMAATHLSAYAGMPTRVQLTAALGQNTQR